MQNKQDQSPLCLTSESVITFRSTSIRVEVDPQLCYVLECLNTARAEFKSAYERLKSQETDYLYESVYEEFMNDLDGALLHTACLVGGKIATDVRRHSE